MTELAVKNLGNSFNNSELQSNVSHTQHNNTSYHNHYNTATIPAPVSPDSKKLKIINFDCTTKTTFSNFAQTFSVTDTLSHIKDVVELNLKQEGFSGSTDDIVLRTIDKKDVGPKTKTLQEIFPSLTNQTIVVNLLDNDCCTREVERKSSGQEIEQKLSNSTPDSGIVNSQSSFDFSDNSSTPIRQRSSTFEKENSKSDQLKSRLKKIIRVLNQSQLVLCNVSQSAAPSHVKDVFALTYDELSECIRETNTSRLFKLRNDLSSAQFMIVRLEVKLNREDVDPSDIVTEAYELVKNIDTATL